MVMMQEMLAQPSRQAPEPAPTPPVVTVRPPGAAAPNPWAPLPLPPRAAGECDSCTRQVNHICLHSNAGTRVSDASERPPASPGPPPIRQAPQLPPAHDDGAVGRWVAAQSRPSEHEGGSDYGRPPLPLDGVHDCAQPPEYAASVASTAHSRQTNPLHKALRNLQKAIANMEEGNDEYKANKKERVIAYETKLMTDFAKKTFRQSRCRNGYRRNVLSCDRRDPGKGR